MGMATTASNLSRSHSFKLDYNVKITFAQENMYGAKICRVVKIEDCHSHFDLALWVNYQGDRYMGRDGVSYLFTDNPDAVDVLGRIVPREAHYVDEVPSRSVQPNLKMINLVVTKRVLIGDDNRALYKRNDLGSEFFYHRKNPLKHSLTDEKVLYVFFNRTESFHKSIILKDTFCQEWDLLSDFKHLGRSFNRGGETSNT
ncbi:hypothetical protein GOP47_0006623 [Adiantum capillus-veneris]|uniref:Uncharacterized protein n=1 Tax=Adiantum capillus-veneris TaxID=13818 RepID=A0A9D4ZM82_ADICA|nr:hypothetical protein GOP47_0006623 [Adiantum capillus-veneris]